MTSDDRFDRRLESGVADLAAPRFPDYFDDVLAVTSRTRQRPAWTFPGRWIPMVDMSRQRAIAPGVPWRALAILVAALLIVALAVATFIGAQHHTPAPPFGVARNGLVAHVENAALYATDPKTGESRLLLGDANDVGGSKTDSAAFFASPAFSLDGTRLAVLRTHAGNLSDLFVADADGAHPVKLNADSLVDVQDFAWSPDGRSIAIGVGLEADTERVLIARTDGSGIAALPVATPQSQPAWRPPDGRDLLFRGANDQGAAMFLVHPDGTDLRPLGAPGSTDGYNLANATWSPDGSRIAYLLDRQDPYQARIHAINADGSGHVVLSVAPTGIQDYSPVWSPDGRHLVVYRWQIASGAADKWVAIIPADGSNAGVDADYRVNDASLDLAATWSPDGSQVLAVDKLTQRAMSIDPTTGKTTTLPWSSIQLPTWQRLAP